MNIFNLFRKRPKTETATTEAQANTATFVHQSENIPPIDLFIDNEPPQLKQHLDESKPTKIDSFLNRNYHDMGVNDGFEYHSQDMLETVKKKILADFMLMIDQVIQEKSEKKLQTKNLIVDVQNISEEARLKLDNVVEELNASLTLLQMQKELSAENEGWVMTAIHQYHQGFIQGLNDFIEGENLLNSIKNI